MNRIPRLSRWSSDLHASLERAEREIAACDFLFRLGFDWQSLHDGWRVAQRMKRECEKALEREPK